MIPPLPNEELPKDQMEHSLLLAFLGLAVLIALGTAKISLSLLWTNVHSVRNKPAHRLITHKEQPQSQPAEQSAYTIKPASAPISEQTAQ